MTNAPDNMIEENMVLSNRDKSKHGDERGLDQKAVQSAQREDIDSAVDRDDAKSVGR